MMHWSFFGETKICQKSFLYHNKDETMSFGKAWFNGRNTAPRDERHEVAPPN